MDAPSSANARFAPAAARNRDPILAVLREHLPASGLVLEIASGTGEHAVHFAAALPGLTWQPSDPGADARASIAAHREMAGLANLLAPVDLDAALPAWPLAHADAIVSINMIHIAPWAACLGLIAGAGRLLPPKGILFLYGPFRENGGFEAASNAAFDADLRRRNPAWGIRDREEVADVAAKHGLQFVARVAMPANNLSLVFRKAPAEPR